MIQRNSAAMAEAFVFSNDTKLDSDAVEKLFQIKDWSSVHSNRHVRELATQTHWRELLVDLDGLFNIYYLLMYCNVVY